MVFQMGFPKKLNVPMRKMTMSKTPNIGVIAKINKADVDKIVRPGIKDVDRIVTKKMSSIKGYSQDIQC